MGKDKEKLKSHRSKQLPASSSQAAALFGQQPGFIGFSAFSQPVDQGIDVEYGLVFKAMNKKDPTTKVKALQEFVGLLSSKPPVDTQTSILLSQWGTLYTKLSDDHEWRVRAQAQSAMGTVSLVVKKQLALYLKVILPVWVRLLFDENKEVSVAAHNALQLAIPSHKHSDALVFCKIELLGHLRECFIQTPQTLSDTKSSSEEAHDKYIRVISTSMLALNFFIEHMPPTENEKLIPEYSQLFTPTFWKFLSNKSGVIRRASYVLLKGVAKLLKPLLAWTPSLAKDVLGLFAEKDPLAYPALWDALLSFIAVFPEVWSSVDAHKHVFPRLHSFLRAGVYGTSSVSYPSLLPFISLLPKSLITVTFVRDFFASLWKGLFSESLLNNHTASAQPRSLSQKSKQAGTCLMDAYFECLTFVWGHFLHEPELLFDATEFIIGDGMWIPLADFFKETLLYSEDSLLGGVNKILSKLGQRDSALVKFWTKFEDFCKDFLVVGDVLFCSRLALFLKSLVAHSIAPPKQTLAELFNYTYSTPLVVSRVSLGVLLAQLWPLDELVDNPTVFFVNTILPLFPCTLDNEASVDVSLTLVELSAVFIARLGVEKHCWGQLLRSLKPLAGFSTTQAKLLVKLIGYLLTSTEEIARNLKHELLDQASNEIAKSLVIEYEKAKLLTIVLGNNPHSLVLIEVETLLNIQSAILLWLSSAKVPHTGIEEVIQCLLTSTFDYVSKNNICGNQTHVFIQRIEEIVTSLFSYGISMYVQTQNRKLNELFSWWARAVKTMLLVLDAQHSQNLKQAIMTELRSHIMNTGEFFSAASLGELSQFVCEAFSIDKKAAFDSVVLMHEWISLTNQMSQILVPNYIESVVLPILPPSSEIVPTSTELQQYTRVCLYNAEVVRILDNIEGIHGSQVITLLHCAAVVANWTTHLSIIGQLATFPSISKTSLLVSTKLQPDSSLLILENAITLLQKSHCSIYAFAIERIAHTLNEHMICSGTHTSAMIEKMNGPIVPFITASDSAIAIFIAAVGPFLSSAVSTDCSYFNNLSITLVSQLEGAQESSTRALEAISVFVANDSLFPVTEIPKLVRCVLSQLSATMDTRRSIAVCKILVHIVLTEFVNWTTSVQLHVIDSCARWLELGQWTSSIILLRYLAAKLYTRLVFLYAQTKMDSEEYWHNSQLILQNKIFNQLLNVRNIPFLGNSGLSLLLDKLTYDFRTIPLHIFESSLNEAFPLLSYPHTEVQKWAYRHIADCLASPTELSSIFTDEELHYQLHAPHFALLSQRIEWERILGTEETPQAYSHIFGYFLAWKILLKHLAVQNAQVRSAICSSLLRLEGCVDSFLDNIFKCIFYPIANERGALPANYGSQLETFTLEAITGEITHTTLQLCSGLLFDSMLSCVPGMVRMWWSDNADKRLALQVDAFASAYACPHIAALELDRVISHKTADPEFSLTAVQRTREVLASYTKDDMVISITLTLPPNYPLRSATVSLTQRVNVGEALWRKWLLSMTTLLLTNEGTVLDACLLWKNSLDKHFEGVEVCPICYSMFFGGQLPRLTCRTCKNKFHSACMYKWFNTSHKSNCPLCQTEEDESS